MPHFIMTHAPNAPRQKVFNIDSDSDFPSLSNNAPAPQHHQQNAQIWANSNLRTQPQQQQPPVNRPQVQQNNQSQQPQPSNQQAQSQEDGVSSPFSATQADYRFGGQAGVGQLSGSSQPQTGNIEEFPPLGGAELGQDRRTDMIQNAAFRGPINGSAFPGQLAHGRNGLSSPSDMQQDRLGSAIGDSRMGAARSPLDGGDRNGSFPSHHGSIAGLGQPVQQPIGRPQHLDQQFGSDTIDNAISIPQHQHRSLSEMTDIERYGLPGLLSMLSQTSPDHSDLAVGQDLTQLGLDLNRPDNSPLYPTFGSPFAEAGSRPAIPDFTLPPAYTVGNVPPLHTKIPSFGEETLFQIFYQNPRDLSQELAAAEL